MFAERAALLFTFDNVRFDQSAAEDYYAILLGVVGDFTITIAGKTLYVEEEFCLAEFAAEVAAWWRRLALMPCDFSYESIESDDIGLVWIREREGNWQIGGLDQEYEGNQTFPLEAIGKAIEDYIADLHHLLATRFALDLNAFIRLHMQRYPL